MYSMRGPRHNHCITVSLTAQLLLQGLHEKLTQAMVVASAVWQIPVESMMMLHVIRTRIYKY